MSLAITYLSGLLFNVLSGLAFHLAERWRPFRRIDYRARWRGDFAALAYVWVIFTLVNAAETRWAGALGQPWLADWPLWLTLPLFYVLYDFLAYWAHRLMHTAPLWRTHVWHHSPKDIWWLSGCRASIGHALLYRLAFLPFFFCLFPPVVALAISTEVILANSWMHLNLKWYPWMRTLEKVLVTPRFHALHHGVGPAFHDRNFGARFTVWDRWFGTYLDPDTVDPKTLQFGIRPDDDPGTARAAIGV
jgi:sterol desaturase/sphingolipid hydroxylase (fatty acid hydroxylase superfamily)